MKILGYDVTFDQEADAKALTPYIEEIAARYDALEAALALIDTTIAELSQDWQPGQSWNPRPADYWQGVTAALSSLREAAAHCLAIFSREPGERPPLRVPAVFVALSYTFRFGIHSLHDRLDNAGILLTGYCPVCLSSSSSHLRKRQALLGALQDLARQTHRSIVEARATLDEAPKRQAKLYAPSPHRAIATQEPDEPGRLRMISGHDQTGEEAQQ